MRERSAVLKSQRLTLRKRRKIFFVLIGFVVFIIIFLVGLIFISRSDFLLLNEVDVSGLKSINESEIKEVANTHLKGDYFFGTIPKASMVLFDKENLERDILNKFPSIESVEVKAWNKSVSIQLKERKPVALWCETACFFIDGTGLFFDKAPAFDGNIYLKFRGLYGESNIVLKETRLLDENKIKTLIKVKEGLAKEKLYFNEVELVSSEEVKLIEKTGLYLIINPADDPKLLVEKVVATLALDVIKEKGHESIEYIDTRFGNKLFFKEEL